MMRVSNSASGSAPLGCAGHRFGFGAAKDYAFAYLLAALLLVALHYYNRGREAERTGGTA
jgi:hypothetical protein